jgi:hypothetical protein
MSLKSKLSDDLANANLLEDNRMKNQPPPRPTKLPPPGVIAAKRAVPRGPLAKFTDSHYNRGWVKASTDATDSSVVEKAKPSVKAKTERKDSVETMKPVSEARKENAPVSSSQKVSDKKSSVPSTQTKMSFLKRGFFRKSKSAPVNVESETLGQVPSEKTLVEEEPLPPPANDVAIVKDQVSSDVSSASKTDTVTQAEDQQLQAEIATSSLADLASMAPSIAPMASLDCLETASLGSVHSDDLMLDLDMCLDDVEYEEKAVPEPRGQRSRSNSGRLKARSRSRSQSTEEHEEVQRQDSTKRVSKECIVESPCEALDELASLLDNNPLLW